MNKELLRLKDLLKKLSAQIQYNRQNNLPIAYLKGQFSQISAQYKRYWLVDFKKGDR